VETFILEAMKLGLVPGAFVVLLYYVLQDKNHMRDRLEKREDELLAAYNANIQATHLMAMSFEKQAEILNSRPCVHGVLAKELDLSCKSIEQRQRASA